MAYNGIGLVTPRGSATSGYVQRNLAQLSSKQVKSILNPKYEIMPAPKNKKPNKQILEHERKRKIELLCIQHSEKLKLSNKTPKEINKEMKIFRKKIENRSFPQTDKELNETHAKSEAILKRNLKLREAFRLPESHKTGEAFKKPEEKNNHDNAEESLKETLDEQERLKLAHSNFLYRASPEKKSRSYTKGVLRYKLTNKTAEIDSPSKNKINDHRHHKHQTKKKSTSHYKNKNDKNEHRREKHKRKKVDDKENKKKIKRKRQNSKEKHTRKSNDDKNDISKDYKKNDYVRIDSDEFSA